MQTFSKENTVSLTDGESSKIVENILQLKSRNWKKNTFVRLVRFRKLVIELAVSLTRDIVFITLVWVIVKFDILKQFEGKQQLIIIKTFWYLLNNFSNFLIVGYNLNQLVLKVWAVKKKKRIHLYLPTEWFAVFCVLNNINGKNDHFKRNNENRFFLYFYNTTQPNYIY